MTTIPPSGSFTCVMHFDSVCNPVLMFSETALKLDTLVGDIEDAVSSSVNRNLRKNPSAPNSEVSTLKIAQKAVAASTYLQGTILSLLSHLLQEVRLVAIKALKQAEDVLASVTKTRPQWSSLVSAVDHRVDRALAILRPQAIADHRSLLASLGWPPPLSTLNSTNLDTKTSTEVSNPLFTMEGDLKHQYCENFLALCRLQELQGHRKSRQLQGHDGEVSLHQPLWGIEELVNPISIASQRHFLKWIDKPEYIFALVFKITSDYVDSMDELLQPLVDEAMLSGYSCREEWISAIVTSLSMYMAKEMFPLYISRLDEESGIETPAQARTSWLHLVDLMISFDKKVRSLLLQSGIFLSLEDQDKIMQITLVLG